MSLFYYDRAVINVPEFAVFKVYNRIVFVPPDIFAFIRSILPEHLVVYAVINHFLPLFLWHRHIIAYIITSPKRLFQGVFYGFICVSYDFIL